MPNLSGVHDLQADAEAFAKLRSLIVLSLGAEIYELRVVKLRIDFLYRLTILDLMLCERFKSLDELPISLQAIHALSLEWILTESKRYDLQGIPFQLRADFLNRLTILDLTLCKRFKSLDELPISLQAMDANNTMSLEWILTGSNWKLSKQLECFGSSKLLQKNPTGNPRKKLIKVSLSLSLSLSLEV